MLSCHDNFEATFDNYPSMLSYHQALSMASSWRRCIEESRLGLHYLQMLEGNVVKALGLIIAVDFLQLLV